MPRRSNINSMNHSMRNNIHEKMIKTHLIPNFCAIKPPAIGPATGPLYLGQQTKTFKDIIRGTYQPKVPEKTSPLQRHDHAQRINH